MSSSVHATRKLVVRREQSGDEEGVRLLVAAAFARPATAAAEVVEARLVDELRRCPDWIPELSLVAEQDQSLAGYVVCSRGRIEGRPVLALGPLAVAPDHQGQGIGSALMHAVIGAGDALGESLVVLLGHLDYYPQFGFLPAASLGITPPVGEWGEHFQARPLTTYDPSLRGLFAYPEPFNEL